MGSWPFRAKTTQCTAILLYHRVAELQVDPWGLAVTPGHFNEQLEVIRKHATVLALPDLVARLRNGQVPPRGVVVTFDDGYADILEVAKPALDHHAVTATAFLATGRLGGQQFWWDELQDVFLTAGTLPETLALDIDQQVHRWSLEDDARYTADQVNRFRAWRAGEPRPTRRHAVFVELWGRLKNLREPARRIVLDALAAWSGRGEQIPPAHRTLTEPEVHELAHGGQITIGAHTVTHPRLSALSPSEQRTELTASRQHIETLLNRRIDALAYPFGGRDDYTATTVSIARDSGFSCACAAVGGAARRTDDPHALPRCLVPDVGGARFEEMLDRWLHAA